MSITYKDTHDFSAKELEDLFLSVEWSSGHSRTNWLLP